jgi:hypothetical protein
MNNKLKLTELPGETIAIEGKAQSKRSAGAEEPHARYRDGLPVSDRVPRKRMSRRQRAEMTAPGCPL